VTVYFGKDGNVEALSFVPGSKGPPKAPAAQESGRAAPQQTAPAQAAGAGK
jgi:hypothetical protein